MKRTTILAILLTFAIAAYMGISQAQADLVSPTPPRPTCWDKAGTPVPELPDGTCPVLSSPIPPTPGLLRGTTESAHGMLPQQVVSTNGDIVTTYNEKPGIHAIALEIAIADVRFRGLTAVSTFPNLSGDYYRKAISLFGTGEWVDENPGELQ